LSWGFASAIRRGVYGLYPHTSLDVSVTRRMVDWLFCSFHSDYSQQKYQIPNMARKKTSRPISGQTTCRFQIRQSLCTLDLIAPISELRTLPMLWRTPRISILSPGIKAIAPLIVTCVGPTLVSHAPALLAINPRNGAPSLKILTDTF